LFFEGGIIGFVCSGFLDARLTLKFDAGRGGSENTIFYWGSTA